MSRIVVIKDGVVVATHQMEQWSSVESLYPGCDVVRWHGTGLRFGDPDPRTIDDHRSEKLVRLQDEMNEAQGNGVSCDGLVLTASTYDQNRFAALLVGVNNAIELGAMNSSSEVVIWDAGGVARTLTVAQFKVLAAQYMAACMVLEQRLAVAQQAVASAETIEDVKAVVF